MQMAQHCQWTSALEGELDPATPISGAEIVAANFDGANQHYFEIPYGAHTTASPTSEGTDCAITLFHEWLDDPTRRPSDCRSDVQPVDFRSTTELARLLFDTDDLWD